MKERRRAASNWPIWRPNSRYAGWAAARLAQLVATETDALVWQNAVRAAAGDNSPSAVEMAYTGIGHASAKVRRRACEYLAAHGNRRHERVLIPALDDKDHAVVCTTARAVGAAGKMDDTRPLVRLLGSSNEEIQMEACLAILRLGDAAGKPALGAAEFTPRSRNTHRSARAMGEFPDRSFMPALIRLLDDNLTASRAALESLPQWPAKTPRASDPPPSGGRRRTRLKNRWKRWYERQLIR